MPLLREIRDHVFFCYYYLLLGIGLFSSSEMNSWHRFEIFGTILLPLFDWTHNGGA